MRTLEIIVALVLALVVFVAAKLIVRPAGQGRNAMSPERAPKRS